MPSTSERHGVSTDGAGRGTGRMIIRQMKVRANKMAATT